MSEHNGSWLTSTRSALAVVSIAVGFAAQSVGAPAQAQSLIYPPNQPEFGSDMDEWSATWWEYILSIPASRNPLLDKSGHDCMLAQHGPVWFLAGSPFGDPVTRTCSVPQDKALFFPILNLLDLNVGTQSANQLQAEIQGCMNAGTVSNLSLTVDGQGVAIDSSFRIRSVTFAVVLPNQNLFGLPSGTYSPAVDDGYYVMLKPLSVGVHSVHFTGAFSGCSYPPTQFSVGPFSLDVAYTLNIVSLQ